MQESKICKYKKSYFISSQVYLQNCNDNNGDAYKNIVTINMVPDGPLRKLVRRVQNRPLSVFQGRQYNSCLLALVSLIEPFRLMDVNEVPNLISFLSMNGYIINTNITQMFNTGNIQFGNNQTLFFLSY
jgi:hypothetical protein